MKQYKKLALALLLLLMMMGCGSTSNSAVENVTIDDGNTISTVPAISLEVQTNYKSGAIEQSLNSANTVYLSEISDAEMQTAVNKNNENIDKYNDMGDEIDNIADADESNTSVWNTNITYSDAGTKVKYGDGTKYGIFVNAYWSQGNEPSFKKNWGPWKILKRTTSATNDTVLYKKDTIDDWDSTVEYSAGDIIRLNSTVYKATGWSKDMTPKENICETWDNSSGCTHKWQSPWVVDTDAGNSTELAITKIEKVGGGKPDINTPPQDTGGGTKLDPENTPIVPPVIPTPEEEVEPAPAPTPIVTSGDTGLPSDGYEFLRAVSTTHWDWMFPLRSGKYNVNGGTRNTDPELAPQNGSKDTFSLANFKQAVLEYNAWAKENGYKQFLNEGSKKQQAQEFIIFWAKSSRETSGSWSSASTPWIEDSTEYDGKVWKGGLYWVEEVGYSTKDDGTSDAISYVDTGSTYTPVSGRSYYGRGVIQLSWNYNYGAFSAWMYDNGLMTNVITDRDTLLDRPDYVATKGDISILSGIWFWMTPQGAKPSSHDVLYGDISTVSKTTQEQGLPQSNDDSFNDRIPTASGDSSDEGVMAYRVGTIINIVNGGLECNKAAKWHGGPPQRVSYFNAYSMYFNAQMSGLDAIVIEDAINQWDEKVNEDSTDILKSATCYNQKSYYGW